jgi:CHAD domain-containing protein
LPHRIGKHEAVDGALWRLIRDDLAKARDELGNNGAAEKRIHRVRQRLKRMRSLMRVVGPALPDRGVRIRRSLRDAAHLLAGARDADAAAASARDLRSAAGPDDHGLDRVVAELNQKASEAHQRATPVAEVRRRLIAAEKDIAAAPERYDAEGLFDRSLVRSYRKGGKAMRRAQSSLATPDLHRWRKAVKDLWHLLRLARKRLPGQAAPEADKLSRLSELLGLDHDHAMLAERLALSPDADPALMRQLSLIARERRSLEGKAFALGAKLYDEKPKSYARKMRLD